MTLRGIFTFGSGIVARLFATAARIVWNAACLRRVGLVPGRVPIGRHRQPRGKWS